MDIRLRRASRGMLLGKTGSGKSRLALELIDAMPLPVLIVDTKYSRGIGDAAIINEWEIVDKIPRKLTDVVVWRPSADMLADPYSMDAELDRLVRHHAICSIYIDELYQLHRNGRAGPGVIGLWTRGREMGFTTLAASQRPAWISTFCLTESDQYYIFTLTQLDDRKRLAESLGTPVIVDQILDKYWFWYVRQGEEAVLCQPYDYGNEDLRAGADVAISINNGPRLIK